MSRLVAAIVIVGLVSGCGLTFQSRGGPIERAPVSGEELGPVFDAPNGGPPIECRGLAEGHCLSPGSIEDPTGGVMDPAAHWTTSSASADVRRVIVSCEIQRCDDAGGAFRIDVVLEDGSTQEIGRGGYGEFEQP